jgi:hypothetical protein
MIDTRTFLHESDVVSGILELSVNLPNVRDHHEQFIRTDANKFHVLIAPPRRVRFLRFHDIFLCNRTCHQ